MNPNLETLVEMLSYCRPMGSRHERKFRRRYLLNLPGVYEDLHGNLHVEVGTGARVLWSSHTDTVHRHSGRQTVKVTDDGYAYLPPDARSSCLGADDTVGVYLMREMILRGVPGWYTFHYGEERGGIGSGALSRSRSQWFKRFTMAIALDRAGVGDVVTHQAGGRTASDRFAENLGEVLNTHNPAFAYLPSHGVYTDTAEYAHLIPECTNLSVGYYHQHFRDEIVDLVHVDRLLESLVRLDVAELPIDRDPAEDDWGYGYYGTHGRSYGDGMGWSVLWDRWDATEDDGYDQPLPGCGPTDGTEDTEDMRSAIVEAHKTYLWPDTAELMITAQKRDRR